MAHAQPETSESTSLAAAGWYQDPLDPQRRRYWDGRAWTEHVTEPSPPPTPMPSSTEVHADARPTVRVQRGETITLRYEGPISGLRRLRRRLETSGLDVHFGIQGMSMQPDPQWPGRNCTGRWFQVVAMGDDSERLCRAVISSWTHDGTVSIV